MTLTLIPSAIAAWIAGRPARVAGILTSRFGRSISCPELPRLGQGALGLVSQPRVDLDGHPSVHVAGPLGDRCQQVAGRAHVIGRQGADHLIDVVTSVGQGADLVSRSDRSP